jgi:O-antigen/teichoic acid export membrane protein
VTMASSGRDLPLVALLLTFGAIVLHVPLLVAEGALQGSHRYAGLAWSYAASGVLRAPLLLLLLVAPLGDVNATVLAVLLAVGIGAAWAVGLTVPATRGAGRPSDHAWRGFTGPLPAIAIGLGGIAVLQNVDVIAAKLSLGGTEAGLFGAAAVIAKGLLVIPQALTIVLLPRVAEQEARGKPTGSFLAVGVLVMAVAGLAAMAVAAVIEGPVMQVAFGSQFELAAALLVPFLGATTLLGALLILVNHHVARSDHRFVWAVGALAVIQVILLIFFSGSARMIIAVDAAVGALGLVAHEVIYAGTNESMVAGAGAQAKAAVRRLRGTSRGAS